MSGLLDGIDSGALLQHVPLNVRSSLELLDRAGMDWNAVGSLLAGAPTTGVVLLGTGQWTADLWQAVKWEFRSFLCTDSESYAELRGKWEALKHQSPALAIGHLATTIGARLGVDRGVLAPLVTWLVVVARRTGKEELCLILPTSCRHT